MTSTSSHQGYPIRQLRGGRRIGGAPVILGALQTEVPKTITQHAEDVLVTAGRNIDANLGGKGIALGPGSKEQDLKASGYVMTPLTPSAYEDAKSAAASTGSRDARRGLWAPPAQVSPRTLGFNAVVSYALGRAQLMHGGYTRGTDKDDGDGSRMVGTPWLDDAFDERLRTMDARLAKLGLILSRIRVPAFPPRR